MRCSSCHRENAADASFCSHCGARLALACPDCARPIRADSLFCDGCGRQLAAGHHDDTPSPASVTPPHLAAKILRDRASLVGERRTVTVLFIDAAGSVGTGEKLDHEELHRMVRNCTQRMVEAVHRYEGTVVQFRGDGIMALFGAPIAHEDATRRAISAALAMSESLQAYERELRAAGARALTYRIGIHTGPVVVGRIGDDLSMDYTAIGDTVNLASRMEQWAPPGKTYITEAAHRLAAGYFEFVDLGMLEVEGKAEPVHAYEVQRELPSRTRLDAAADRGLTPFVGRDHELAVLRGHFEQAKAGHGQVVFVSGEAGMGKSRLMLEFQRSLEGEDITWLSGQCISYGSNAPFLPIIDLLKRNFNVDEGDDAEDIIARIDERAANWDDSTKRAAPYVKFLLNVDPGDARVASMDPMERRAGILDALRALLIRGSSQRTVVMVIEDLHWVDEKSEEAMAALVDVTASARVLMVLTYRPGYTPSLGDRAYYSRLALQSLAADASGSLLEHVLDAGVCPDEIRRLITTKAEGNPFYIEEVTKSLVESGAVRRTNGALHLARPISEVYVPETIQEVILTRIDRLEADAKEALQLASVIGREFTARLLDRISQAQTRLEGVLGELKALELIYEKAYFPELSYMFKHALTHDVAYSTLLEERRRNLHRIVAAAVEELYADRLAEQYETLAYHYARAEQWEKALHYLAQAGDKATASFASKDAIRNYEQALEICARLGDPALATAASIGTRKAEVHRAIAEFDAAIRTHREVVEVARRLGDRHLEGMSLVRIGESQFWRHDDFDQTVETFLAALRIGEEEFEDVRMYAASWLGMQCIAYGEIAESMPYYGIATELAPRVRNTSVLAEWAFLGSMPPHWFGRYDEAVNHLAHWGRVAEDSNLLPAMLSNQWVEALARGARGEYAATLDLLLEVLATCDRVGEVPVRARTLNTIGWLYGEIEDHERAARWSYEGIVAAQEAAFPDPECEANARLNLADALVALSRPDEASEHYQWVERILRNPTPPERFALWIYGQHLLHSYGVLCLGGGDLERAFAFGDECARRAEDTGRRKNLVKGLRLRGQALLAQGKHDDAERDLVRALEVATEIGNPRQLRETYAALGDLRSAQGRAPEACEHWSAALRVLDETAAGLTEQAMRDTLMTSAAAQRLRQLVAGGS